MNLNEYQNFKSHLLSAITLHPRKQEVDFFIFVINGNQSFISQIHRALSPLGKSSIFFSPLGFEAKSDFDHKPSKLKSHSQCYSSRGARFGKMAFVS